MLLYPRSTTRKCRTYHVCVWTSGKKKKHVILVCSLVDHPLTIVFYVSQGLFCESIIWNRAEKFFWHGFLIEMVRESSLSHTPKVNAYFLFKTNFQWRNKKNGIDKKLQCMYMGCSAFLKCLSNIRIFSDDKPTSPCSIGIDINFIS